MGINSLLQFYVRSKVAALTVFKAMQHNSSHQSLLRVLFLR